MNLQEFDNLLNELTQPISPLSYCLKYWNERPYPSALVHIPVDSWTVRHRTVMLARMGVNYQLIPYNGKGVF
jgi:hypothetical protein